MPEPIKLINGKNHNKLETRLLTNQSDFLKYKYLNDSISNKGFMEVYYLKDKKWYKILLMMIFIC